MELRWEVTRLRSEPVVGLQEGRWEGVRRGFPRHGVMAEGADVVAKTTVESP